VKVRYFVFKLTLFSGAFVESLGKVCGVWIAKTFGCFLQGYSWWEVSTRTMWLGVPENCGLQFSISLQCSVSQLASLKGASDI
jgi:hypothetical protein